VNKKRRSTYDDYTAILQNEEHAAVNVALEAGHQWQLQVAGKDHGQSVVSAGAEH